MYDVITIGSATMDVFVQCDDANILSVHYEAFEDKNKLLNIYDKTIAGKTGFTDYKTSGQCLVSFAKGDDGKDYIVVTAKAQSAAARFDDHLYLYNTYAK